MITMNYLEKRFNEAIECNYKYVAVVVRMEDFKGYELIINPIGNAKAKLEYYKGAYNDDLTHKHAKDKIQIVDATYGDTLAQIEDNFNEWRVYR